MSTLQQPLLSLAGYLLGFRTDFQILLLVSKALNSRY